MSDPLHQPGRPDTAWTRGNLGEALPGVCTALGWTFFGSATEAGIRRGFRRIGALRRAEAPIPAEVSERFCTVMHGWGSSNIDLMARMAERMPGVDPEQMERQLFGEVRAVRRHPTRRRYAVIAVMMPVELMTALGRVRRTRARTEKWWRHLVGTFADPHAVPPGQALATILQAHARFSANMAVHTTISMIGSGLFDQITALAQAAGPGHSAAQLVTGHGRLEETRIATDLWAVSRGTLELAAFLERHGYQGPDAGQLHVRVWREDPAPLRQLARTYAELPDSRCPTNLARTQTATRRRAEAALLRALPAHRRIGARILLALTARFVPHRESGKAGYLMAVDGARTAARALGSRWAGEGWLADPEDIFHLTLDELVAGPNQRTGALVAERRRRRAELTATALPEAWVGVPAPIEPPMRASGPGPIAGVGVHPGVVEGLARVVREPQDAELEPGEILVCATTDPSWVSLFIPAGGVVIDVGGQMSHGAIVARELGIPCVINTRDGTRRIRTGDRLRIDGASGEVVVLDQAPLVQEARR
ncbi:MAG TPA: PEP-utilizing enzyme [Pseudonocardia sp.]|jgi:pyruvate,water dikinase